MATIEGAMRELLLADPQVVALVGDRVYPQDAPQDAAPPMVVYQTADLDQSVCVSGVENEFSQSFRFDCYGGAGEPYASAKAVADAVRTRALALEIAAAQGGRIVVEGVAPEGGEDGLEPPAFGEGDGIDYVGVQARVFWRTN